MELQANIPEPNTSHKAAELFSVLPEKHLNAAGLAMRCVIRSVTIGLCNESLLPALLQFLFSEQSMGRSVVSTLNTYAKDLSCCHRFDENHLPVLYMLSLIELVRKARQSSDAAPTPSLATLMHPVRIQFDIHACKLLAVVMFRNSNY